VNQITYLHRVERVTILISILYVIHYYLGEALKKGGRINCTNTDNDRTLMNPISSTDLTPYFFTLKQVATFLNTSASTYRRRERKGLAPKGKQLLGSTKLYPKAEIILFAEGKWECV
jgi:hypothetical protein